MQNKSSIAKNFCPQLIQYIDKILNNDSPNLLAASFIEHISRIVFLDKKYFKILHHCCPV